MKKLLSLILVLVMVLAIAPAVFAEEPVAGTVDNPIFLYEQENTVTNVGTTYYGGRFDGMIMTVTGATGFSVIYDGNPTNDTDGVVTMIVTQPDWFTPVSFAIVGDGEFSVKFTHPLGTMGNPDALVFGSNTATIAAGSQGYYYSWTADVAGLLTITMGGDNWFYTISNQTSYASTDNMCSGDDPVVKTTTIAVNAGDEIRVIVNTYDPNSWDIPAGEVSFTASFRVGHGTVEYPFEAHTVNDVSAIEVAAGSLTYIAMNSQLNGMILNVAAQEGIALIVNDVIVPAVDGMFSVELTGVPANKVIVANTTEAAVELNASLEYPLGSEGNPIMVGNAADLSKIEVAAGSTTYIAINAMLNGNYLTIKGDSNTVVEVNGQAVTAKNGVFSVELTGAPMNRVVITNNGNAAATYDAAIGEPIPATGETMMVLPMILAVVCVLGLAVVATKKVAA